MNQLSTASVSCGPGDAITTHAAGDPCATARIDARALLQCASECALEVERHLLSLAVNETDTAIVVTDPDGTTIYVNDGFTRMLGYTQADMQGKVPSAIVTGRYTDEETLAYVRERVMARDSFRAEILVYDRLGKPLWISAVVNAVKNRHGECTSMVGVWTDITHTKMHEVLQHKVLHAMAREAPIFNVMLLICLEVERIAPEVIVSIRCLDKEQKLRILGAPSLPGHYVKAIDGVVLGHEIGGREVPGLEGQLVTFAEQPATSFWGRQKELAQSCGLATYWWHTITSSDGRTLGTLAFYFRESRHPDNLHRRLADVSLDLGSLALEREASKDNIRRLAYYDSLTGLPNRSALMALTESLIADATRKGQTLALLFLDLDRFKQVNDTFGHSAGDTLLCGVARRIEACMFESDLVGRLAGDEFVIVLTPCDAEEAALRCASIMAKLSEPIMVGSMTITPTASVGIALFPQHGNDVHTLLLHADSAMYRAKSAGQHRYSLFDPELNRIAEENLKLGRALREALRTDQLQLHYQPQVSLEDGSIHGVEALARWRHPDFGTISPERFVALAEESGLIASLDRWVQRKACSQLSAWRCLGLAIPHISVNVSPTTFCDRAFPERIAQMLDEHGLCPSDLTLEVTEGVLLDKVSGALANLSAVHALGVGLSIDDFGTGYSSLSYLYRMPVDELKLDKSFVCELESNESARTLAGAVMSIGASLLLDVVAEGIESDAQMRTLQDLGCRVAQGYLFARPMTAEMLVEWMKEPARTLPAFKPPAGMVRRGK
ncbi:sensor domain-containing protein [Paraburkholderia lacunae]|uniref:Bifunctional diguanylate cyclase/phosphodiesterase n=1 Tax=Paraburkholderia lacunae TaxID=2211104 RepID=A0A370N0F5_9BURK|nr:EAL domain-containing protein [Paraburkholderia lacunae]RDJ99100.1 bifunctional diguanylate cyclase/phosphodiesterase [Paraburkholderia lacunae]